METNQQDFTKEFFQQAWGPQGYYEEFNYGVGFNKVVEVCLMPFFNKAHTAVEIGCGGGAFTKKLLKGFYHVTAVDVIKMPEQFTKYSPDKFTYKQVEGYNTGQFYDSKDFAFSYNCFCHLSNWAIKNYLTDINSVLKRGGNFVFMLSNATHHDTTGCELGDCLPVGHFYQDDRTLDLVISDGWDIVSRNMIPEHRDIIVHLKKK